MKQSPKADKAKKTKHKAQSMEDIDFNLKTDIDFDLDLGHGMNTSEMMAERNNPMDEIEYTGDLETDSSAEIAKVLTTFQQADLRQKSRENYIFDSKYWVCFVFQSRSQKADFLRGLPCSIPGSLEGTQYVDGLKVAAAMGIELDGTRHDQKPFKIDKRLAELALPRPMAKKK